MADLSVLEFEKLKWGYDEKTTFGEISTLDLRAGELIAFIGPNGAGKTTLLRTLAGHLSPWAGNLRLTGENLATITPNRRAQLVTMLLPETALDLSLTVEELVALGRTPYISSHFSWGGRFQAKDFPIIERSLVECDLLALRDRRLENLSAGERQRALLAMALCQEVRLLILDEPFNHLDIRRRFEFIKLLKKLRVERRLAMVCVLHELEVAFREADRVIGLDGNRVHFFGEDQAQRKDQLAMLFGVERSAL